VAGVQQLMKRLYRTKNPGTLLFGAIGVPDMPSGGGCWQAWAAESM
jgi:hypothetical protein